MAVHRVGAVCLVAFFGLVARADGLRSQGNCDAVLSWTLGPLAPGQSRRQAAVFAASLDELRATARAARDHLRRLGQPLSGAA